MQPQSFSLTVISTKNIVTIIFNEMCLQIYNLLGRFVFLRTQFLFLLQMNIK